MEHAPARRWYGALRLARRGQESPDDFAAAFTASTIRHDDPDRDRPTWPARAALCSRPASCREGRPGHLSGQLWNRYILSLRAARREPPRRPAEHFNRRADRNPPSSMPAWDGLRQPVRGHPAPGRGDHGMGGGVRRLRSPDRCRTSRNLPSGGPQRNSRNSLGRPGHGRAENAAPPGPATGRLVPCPARRGPAATRVAAAAATAPASAHAQAPGTRADHPGRAGPHWGGGGGRAESRPQRLHHRAPRSLTPGPIRQPAPPRADLTRLSLITGPGSDPVVIPQPPLAAAPSAREP